MAENTKMHRYAGRSAKIIGISIDEYIKRTDLGEKWCIRCRVWHLRIEFGSDIHSWDGLNGSCRKSFRIARPHSGSPNSSRMRGKRHSDATRQRMSLAHAGERNHKWKGGITPAIRRERQNSLYQQWRRTCLNRDGNKCVRCGEINQLHVHHVRPFKENPDLRLDVENGMTLCTECHKAVHVEAKSGQQ